MRRTAANRIDVATRRRVRTTAACRLFPSGEALPSTTSAGGCLPLFCRFLGTTASSDFSSAYMLGVRLLPSRAGPAQVRARVRPPTVYVRPGMVRLRETRPGRNQHCIGTRISGVLIIYKSFASFTGLDTMQYTARVPSDARTYQVEIRVEAGPTASDASSARSELQVAGPMPKCPALVS